MANISRWEPFSEFVTLQDRLNQLFNQGLAGYGDRFEQQHAFSNFVPLVDVYEDEHHIVLQAELPGVDEEDVALSVENNVLTISGERKLETEKKKENFHRLERHYGRFTRSFTLPPTADTQNINAEFENGLLKVTIAKREEAKPKQIKIGSGKTLTQQTLKPGKEKDKAA
ncbi:MAG TPA: Hsp20/alpha crystallin family protein [Candidatus Angelobacter sp.]|jgi:HSP20 family protein|nr:Hsp20/alpha crystallin family protein [Candidatus Angelobacter sp.]